MNELLKNSVFFGFALTFASYQLGLMVKKKIDLPITNPLLIAEAFVIVFLLVFDIDYPVYNAGAQHISYLLTPATVCLAIPLYKQLRILKDNLAAVIGGITSGVVTSGVSIFVLSKLFGLSHQYYVTLLPKSITTAIGMGVSEEAGGIAALTVVAIIISGLFGNVAGETILRVFRVRSSIAKGVALGTAAHAIGTSKALELGEVEGAMGSLSIAVAGLMTVVVVPMAAGLI